MISAEAQKMWDLLRANRKPERPVAQQRAEWEAEAAAQPLPEGTRTEPCQMGGIDCEWITCGPVADKGVVLQLHGGGYCAGNLVTVRALSAHVSKATGKRVLVPDYRLAPEHPYPAGLEDAEAVYTALVEAGTTPGEVVFLGDSAGGGLVISLMLVLRDKGLPQPAGAVLMSPWTDLQCSGPSYTANIETDPNMSREGLLLAADRYRGTYPADYPMFSSIHADLKGLPPMLAQAGGGEIMLDDTVAFAERAKAAGCAITLDVTPGMWHVFQTCVDDVPEGRAAFDRVGAFVHKVMKPA